MRLDRRFAFAAGFSLLWALVVSAVFHRFASAGSGKPRAAAGKELIVAAEPLPLGAVIRPESIKTIRIPENLVPNGAYSRPEEVMERAVVSPIQPGEPLVEARLAARGSGMGLAPLIPPGMRAIAVRVNDVVGVAGFLLPGMRVDVLVTGRPPGSNETITTTVLQNVTVLSAGQTLQADAGKQAINTPVVTLLVSPADAVALTLANNEGHIQLVLRNSTDQQTEPAGGRQLRELYGPGRMAASALSEAPSVRKHAPPVPAPAPAAAPAPAPAAPPAPPPPDPESILMIRGHQKSVEKIP